MSRLFTFCLLILLLIEIDCKEINNGSLSLVATKCNNTNCDNKNNNIITHQSNIQRDKGKNEDQNIEGNEGHERQSYWLVPPFFIAASVIFVVYIIMNSFYMHCYTKKKMKHIAASRQFAPAAIVLTDDPSTATAVNSLETKLIKLVAASASSPMDEFDTDISDTPSFVLCSQPFQDNNEWERQLQQRRRSSARSSVRSSVKSSKSIRRKSSLLQIPSLFSNKKRASVCSAAAALYYPAKEEEEEEEEGGKQTKRGSVCFIPIARSNSVPSTNDSEWTAVPAYVYSSVLIPRSYSYKTACGRKRGNGGLQTNDVSNSNNTQDRPNSASAENSSVVADDSVPIQIVVDTAGRTETTVVPTVVSANSAPSLTPSSPGIAPGTSSNTSASSSNIPILKHIPVVTKPCISVNTAPAKQEVKVFFHLADSDDSEADVEAPLADIQEEQEVNNSS